MPTNTYIANLKTAPDYEVVTRGVCPETLSENRALTVRAFGAMWTRKIDRIDWAQGDYQPFMSTSDTLPAEVRQNLHNEDLKAG